MMVGLALLLYYTACAYPLIVKSPTWQRSEVKDLYEQLCVCTKLHGKLAYELALANQVGKRNARALQVGACACSHVR